MPQLRIDIRDNFVNFIREAVLAYFQDVHKAVTFSGIISTHAFAADRNKTPGTMPDSVKINVSHANFFYGSNQFNKAKYLRNIYRFCSNCQYVIWHTD